MIRDLGLFSWRIGLILVFGMPALYIATAVTIALIREADSPIYQVITAAQMLLPYVFISMGVGCALCLLVRIEMHLRALRSPVSETASKPQG